MHQDVEARKTFEQVLQDNPNYYEALANLGSMALNAGQNEQAKSYFEKTLKLNPVHFYACYFLLEITQEKHYKECVKRYSNDPSLQI